MDIVGIIVALIVIGVIYWLIMQLPIPEPFKTIVNVLAILLIVVWLVKNFLPGTI